MLVNKNVNWQTPELTEVIGKNTGAECAYGNGATTGCSPGRIPSNPNTCALGYQAAGGCATGDSG